MFIKLERYNPPKPYYEMSIEELIRYNKKCIRLDNIYFNKRKIGGERKRRTKNKRNRKTRKRKKRTRRISLQIKKMEVQK